MQRSSVVDVWQLCLRRFPPLELHKGILNPSFSWFTPNTNAIRYKLGLTPGSHFLEGELIYWAGKAKSMWPIVRRLPLKVEWWDAPLALQDFSWSNTLRFLCRHLFHTYSLVYITESVFLPFLNVWSAQKWKETKIYKSEYIAGNITQWFCRAIKQCIISVNNYAAIMMKVTFEMKSSLNMIKKNFYRSPRWLFFCNGVIGNEQFFKVGLMSSLSKGQVETVKKM